MDLRVACFGFIMKRVFARSVYMKRLHAIIIFGILGMNILAACCRESAIKEGKCYPHNKHVCSKDGKPLNATISYLPDSFYIDSSWHKNLVETFFIEAYTRLMHCANEPILYNHYIGRPVIRYSNFGGITIPVTVSITKKGRFWNITTIIYTKNPEPDTSFLIDWKTKAIKAVPNEKVHVRKRFERQLSWNEWNAFSQKLDSLGFPDMNVLKTKQNSKAACGSEDYLEIHLKDRYYFTNRPGQIAMELLRLSDYDEYWGMFH